MTMRLTCCTIAALAVAAAISAGVRVKPEDVPVPASKAIKERFPKAEVRYVDRESKDRYEFAMKEGDRQFDVDVMADGKLLNVKEELAEDKLPAAVKDGVLKKYPGAKFVEIEKVTKLDGKKEETRYEMLIKADGKSHSVEFDSTGKFVGDAD